MYRVLILDAHSKAAAECVICLSSNCEVFVSAGDVGALSFATSRVKERWLQPVERGQFLKWLLDADEIYHFSLIIASTETSLKLLKGTDYSVRLREKLVIPDEYALDVALDKARSADLATDLGISVPASNVITSGLVESYSGSFPVVIKPVTSKVLEGSVVRYLQVRVCNSELERRLALKEILPHADVIQQEYFRGKGVGVEALFVHGQLRVIFCHERIHEYPTTGGASTYRKSIPIPPQLREATVKLLERLRWHGVAMVEFKVGEAGAWRFIEINPRLWGSLPLAGFCGISFPQALLSVATSNDVVEQFEYRTNLYARDLMGDIRWFFESMRSGACPNALKRVGIADWVGLVRPLLGVERWDLFRFGYLELWWESLRSLREKIVDRRPLSYLLGSIELMRVSLSRRRVLDVAMKRESGNVLIVCYGNICRSPLVEAVIRSMRPGCSIVSRGFHTASFRKPPQRWIDVVRETVDFDISGHRSAVLSQSDVDQARLIVVMDLKNFRDLRRFSPGSSSKTILLDDYGFPAICREVKDPYSMESTGMRTVANRLVEASRRLAACL